MFTRRYVAVLLALGISMALAACGKKQPANEEAKPESNNAPGATATGGTAPDDTSPEALAQGREIFRFDTFGNEAFWTDTLRMHEVIEKDVDPTTALKVGLKVDADVLPPGILDQVDLKSPATTVALLKMNAVVGLKAEVDANNHIYARGHHLRALPFDGRQFGDAGHRTPKRRLAEPRPQRGRHHRALAGGLGRAEGGLQLLGPRKVRSAIQHRWQEHAAHPSPGLRPGQVQNETYTAEGPISYWNAYVAVTQMHGQGNFSDPRLGINITHSPDHGRPQAPGIACLSAQLGSAQAHPTAASTPRPPAVGARSSTSRA